MKNKACGARQMKVLLINPPGKTSKYKKHSFLRFTAPPLGLAYIAAYVEQYGYDVKIIDAPPLELTAEQVLKIAKRYNPDIIGIQSLTPNYYEAINVANLLKKEIQNALIVMGGPHPSLLPNETFSDSPAVDMIVRGEGKITFYELVKHLEGKKSLKDIQGISYRKNGKIVHNPDRPFIKNLDSLPFPARHLLPMNAYRIFGMRVPGTSMISSRGCSFPCDFCVVSSYWRRIWRARSAKNVVDEMEEIINTYKYLAIAFVDDLFALSKKRVYEIVREIKKRKLDVIWGATVRADTVDRNLLRAMRDAGCVMLYIGVESGDQNVLDSISKLTTVEQYKRFFKWANEIGIDTIASFAIGFPEDTPKSILKTIELAVELNPTHIVFALATPYPGTRFYEQAKKMGIINENDYHKYSLFRPVIKTNNLTPEQLKQYLIYAYQRFYMRPTFLLRSVIHEAKFASEVYGYKIFFRILISGLWPFMRTILSLKKILAEKGNSKMEGD